MYQIRKSLERGYVNFDWLKSYHTFSFGEYYDPQFMGFSHLRVINQDIIKESSGFPMHNHKDMEIITYVYKGTIEHKDSIGNIGQIKHGEIQRMSAGSGIRHSEYNPSSSQKTELLQIWIEPDQLKIQPDYEQVDLIEKFKEQELVLIASPSKENGSAKINQDAKLYAFNSKCSHSVILPLSKLRHGWIQIISGKIKFESEILSSGDAIALKDVENPNIEILDPAHFIFFDLK